MLNFLVARNWVFTLVLISFASPLRAEVGDPTLKTDHPFYPGEGAFQTIEDCVKHATQGKQADQDKAIALYLWLLTHQWHLASPQEPYTPGVPPNTTSNSQENIVYDANRARFSYGYGLCGTVHAWNETYWKALGMNARRRAFPGHVNSEVEYGGSWHAFDTDMAGIVFRPDGIVAGYDDMIRNPKLVAHNRAPLPCYPFAWPGDFETMKKGWEEVAKGGNWYKLYHGGYAAQPGIVHLRSGESFTRSFDRDHFGGPDKRRFWHNQPGGPFRNWTFANQGEPVHQANGEANCRGNMSYANAEFVYQPKLSTPRYREGVWEQSANVVSGTTPHLASKDQQPAFVIFEHFSPYVICGDPQDNANPMTAPASGGCIVEGQAVGAVELDISNDQGQTWHTHRASERPIWLAGSFSLVGPGRFE